MSERADALVRLIAKEAGLHTKESYAQRFPDEDIERRVLRAEHVARAICEHLGIDGGMVFHVSSIMEQNGVDMPLEYDTIAKGRNVDAGRAIATLLEAAGVER